MFGRRRLRGGYGEQTVRETKGNADAFETQTLLDDEVRQRGITEPIVVNVKSLFSINQSIKYNL